MPLILPLTSLQNVLPAINNRTGTVHSVICCKLHKLVLNNKGPLKLAAALITLITRWLFRLPPIVCKKAKRKDRPQPVRGKRKMYVKKRFRFV